MVINLVEVEILENIFQLFEIVVMIPLSRHQWWISSQHPQASQALLFMAFHGTSYLPTALCLPLQQRLKRELVNKKLRGTGQHARAVARACGSLHVHPTKTQYMSTNMRSISRGPSSLCRIKHPLIYNKNQLKTSKWHVVFFFVRQKTTKKTTTPWIDLSLGREGTRIEGALTPKGHFTPPEKKEEWFSFVTRNLSNWIISPCDHTKNLWNHHLVEIDSK